MKALLQQALDALEIRAEYDDTYPPGTQPLNDCAVSAIALRAAIEQGEREPYCWMVSGLSRGYFGEFAEMAAKSEAQHIGGTCKAFPIYTAPVGYVPLSDEQIDAVTIAQWGEQLGVMLMAHRAYARAVERAVRNQS